MLLADHRQGKSELQIINVFEQAKLAALSKSDVLKLWAISAQWSYSLSNPDERKYRYKKVSIDGEEGTDMLVHI